MAYTTDSIWRNRDQFFTGRDAIEDFLTKKWSKENGYRLRKELFAFAANKVCFQRMHKSLQESEESTDWLIANATSIRSPSSSGTNGMMGTVNGTEHMASRTGLFPRTG